MDRPMLCQIPDLWERDGSLRDVYFVGTGLSHWRRFLDFVRAWPHRYSLDLEDAPLPDAATAFAAHAVASPLLQVWSGGVTVCCHFFTESEIELDIDPTEVLGPAEHDAVLAFLEDVAMALGIVALMTPESGQGIPYCSFDPHERQWTLYKVLGL